MRGSVHEYSIERLTAASAHPIDDEGRTVEDDARFVRVRGHVASAGTVNRSLGGQAAQVWDVVARAPLATHVNAGDRLHVSVPAHLAGVYNIGEVRVTAKDLRILGTRVEL